uniref:Uncharacterized protein n=2 Tax=Graphocephala atropunctata TaxID=36148 RepID=A0A1B6KG42_9HEMI
MEFKLQNGSRLSDLNGSMNSPFRVDNKARQELWNSLLEVYENEKGIKSNQKQCGIRESLHHNSQEQPIQNSGTVDMNKLIKFMKKHNKKDSAEIEIGCNNTLNEQIVRDRQKQKKLEKRKKHKKLREMKNNLHYKEPSQPQLIVLHEHEKKINQSSNEMIKVEGKKPHSTQNRYEKKLKKALLREKIKKDKMNNEVMYSKNEKEAVEKHKPCSVQHSKDKIKKRRDKGAVYKTLSSHLESKLRKKKKKLLLKQSLKDGSILHSMTNEIIDKLKSLPFKVDENQLIFMDPSHILKLLEYSNDYNKVNVKNVVCTNQDKNERPAETKEDDTFTTNQAESLVNTVGGKNTSSKHSRDVIIKKSLKKCKRQKFSKTLLSEPSNNIPEPQNIGPKEKRKYRKERSKYTIVDQKNSKINCQKINKFRHIRTNQKVMVRCKGDVLGENQINIFEDKNPEIFRGNLSSQNRKLSTIYSESFPNGHSEENSTMSNYMLPEHSISQDDNNIDKTQELNHCRSKCKSKHDKMINIAKPLISEDGKRLTLQLVKADAVTKNPEKVRNKVYNIERILSEDRCNTVKRDRLMFFYANRESSSTSRDSLNIAISRDTEITKNGSSNNVLNVVIKQVKSTMSSTLTSTEKQELREGGEKKPGNNEKVETSVSGGRERNSIEEKPLKEAGCQTEVFALNCVIQNDPRDITGMNSEAVGKDEAKPGILNECSNLHVDSSKNFGNKSSKGDDRFEEKNTHTNDVFINPLANDLSNLTNKTKNSGFNYDAISDMVHPPRLIQNVNKALYSLSNEVYKKTENDKGSNFCIPNKKLNVSSNKNGSNSHCLRKNVASIKPGQVSVNCNNSNTNLKITQNTPVMDESDYMESKLRKIGLTDKNSFIKVIESETQINDSNEKKLNSEIQTFMDLTLESLNKYEIMRKKYVHKVDIKPEISGHKNNTEFKNKHIHMSKPLMNKANDNQASLPNCVLKNNLKRPNTVHTIKHVPIEEIPIGDHFSFSVDKHTTGDQTNNLNQLIDKVQGNNNIKRENFVVVLPEEAEINSVTGVARTQIKHCNIPTPVRAHMFRVASTGVQTGKIDEVSPDKHVSFAHNRFNYEGKPLIPENTEHVSSPIVKTEKSPCVEKKVINVPRKKCSFIHVINNDMEKNSLNKTSRDAESGCINHTAGNGECSITTSYVPYSLSNENNQKENQIVGKINAIYDFLQYLNKMLKDNTIMKGNVNCNTNCNLGHLNSTLRCLCSNCMDILDQIETNHSISTTKPRDDNKGLDHGHNKSMFLNVVKKEVENDEISCVKYVSLKNIEPQGHKKHYFQSESHRRPFFVVIPSDEKLEENLQNTTESQNYNTVKLCLSDLQLSLEELIDTDLMEKKIRNSKVKEKGEKTTYQEKWRQNTGDYIHITNNPMHQRIKFKNHTVQNYRKYYEPIMNNKIINKPSKFPRENLNFESEIESTRDRTQACLSLDELSLLPEDNIQDFSSKAYKNTLDKNIACSKSLSSECIPYSQLKNKDRYTHYLSEKLSERHLINYEAYKMTKTFKPIAKTEEIYQDDCESSIRYGHTKSTVKEHDLKLSNDEYIVQSCRKVKSKILTKCNVAKSNVKLNSYLEDLETPFLLTHGRNGKTDISLEEKRCDKDLKCLRRHKNIESKHRLNCAFKLNELIRNESSVRIPKTCMFMKQDTNSKHCDDVNINRKCFTGRSPMVPKIEKSSTCKRNNTNLSTLYEPCHNRCDHPLEIPCRAKHSNSHCDSVLSSCSLKCGEAYTKKAIVNGKVNKEMKHSDVQSDRDARANNRVSATVKTLVKRNPVRNSYCNYNTVFNKSPCAEHYLVPLGTSISRVSLDGSVKGPIETNIVMGDNYHKYVSCVRETDSELSCGGPYSQYNDSVVFTNQQYAFVDNKSLPAYNTLLCSNIRSNTNMLAKTSDTENNTVGNRNGIFDTNGWISLSSCDLQNKTKSVVSKDVPDPENKVRLQMDLKMNDIMHVEFFCQPPVLQNSSVEKSI